MPYDAERTDTIRRPQNREKTQEKYKEGRRKQHHWQVATAASTVAEAKDQVATAASVDATRPTIRETATRC